MEKTFYELMEASREISYKNKKEIVKGCTTNQDNVDCKPTNERFEIEEEALEFLSRTISEVRFYESTIPYYKVTEYFVEENTYDEDGTWVRGGDILEYSELPVFK